MATETRNFGTLTPGYPGSIMYEDLGYSGNDQDQFVINTSGVSTFDLTFDDDAWANGGEYVYELLITISGEVTAPTSYAFIDYTHPDFAWAASQLADAYADQGYIVYDDLSTFTAEIRPTGGEQFIVSVQGALRDDPNYYLGGTAHPISYSVEVSDVTSASGGANWGTNFNDVIPFSQLGASYDGLAGLDVVIFNQTYGAYQVTVYGHEDASVNGVDLFDVERLDFANGTLALDIFGNAGQTYRLYQAAFDRMPDQSGLSYWIDQKDDGLHLDTIAQYFVSSSEFQRLYGSNPSNYDFIDALYENVLQRSADADGYAYWNAQMANGLSRGEVLVGFSESEENVDLVGPQIDDGIWLV